MRRILLSVLTFNVVAYGLLAASAFLRFGQVSLLAVPVAAAIVTARHIRSGTAFDAADALRLGIGMAISFSALWALGLLIISGLVYSAYAGTSFFDALAELASARRQLALSASGGLILSLAMVCAAIAVGIWTGTRFSRPER